MLINKNQNYNKMIINKFFNNTIEENKFLIINKLDLIYKKN